MRCVEIVRQELERTGLSARLPIEKRRALVSVAKKAARQGRNPRAEVSRFLRQGSAARIDAQRGPRLIVS